MFCSPLRVQPAREGTSAFNQKKWSKPATKVVRFKMSNAEESLFADVDKAKAFKGKAPKGAKPAKKASKK
jgi:hypothetical protein